METRLAMSKLSKHEYSGPVDSATTFVLLLPSLEGQASINEENLFPVLSLRIRQLPLP